MNTIEKILELANSNGILPGELASILSVNEYIFRDWQRGLREPTITDIVKISDYFGVTTDYLLKNETKNPAPAGYNL